MEFIFSLMIIVSFFLSSPLGILLGEGILLTEGTLLTGGTHLLHPHIINQFEIEEMCIIIITLVT